MGRTNKDKFSYTDPQFLKTIEKLAGYGFTDIEIGHGLIEFYGKSLSKQHFSRLKNEKIDGIYTERAQLIRNSLEKGRLLVNMAVRIKLLDLALGNIKLITTIRKYLKYENGRLCEITEIERELPPNLKAISYWLKVHDPEWGANFDNKIGEFKYPLVPEGKNKCIEIINL